MKRKVGFPNFSKFHPKLFKVILLMLMIGGMALLPSCTKREFRDGREVFWHLVVYGLLHVWEPLHLTWFELGVYPCTIYVACVASTIFLILARIIYPKPKDVSYVETAVPITFSATFPPEDLKDRIRYNASRQLLLYKGVMSEEEKNKLIEFSCNTGCREAIEKLYADPDSVWKCLGGMIPFGIFVVPWLTLMVWFFSGFITKFLSATCGRITYGICWIILCVMCIAILVRAVKSVYEDYTAPF